MEILHAKKVVLLGMMSRIPVAGAIWGTMHYLIGLRRLGYEPYYVECHGLNPSMLMGSRDEDASALAARFIAGVMERFDLQHNWCFHALHERGRYFGLSESQLRKLYKDAALIINYHGATSPLPEHYETGRLVYLETDPVATEIELHDGRPETRAYLEPHRAFFTWGLNYGNPDCRVPLPKRTDPRFDFKLIPPAVVCDLWERPDAAGAAANGNGNGTAKRRFTTIGNWKQETRPVLFEGELYTWSKHHEFLKVIDLPARTSQPFELALARYEPADKAMLEAKGWHVSHALDFSRDLDAYRAYVQNSRGEFTVAKDQNVRLRSGWFSERSAQYLAAGRPVITQDTGFGSYLPLGNGLFAFQTAEDVVWAVESLDADYDRHCRGASEIARTYMNYDVVLPQLLESVGA